MDGMGLLIRLTMGSQSVKNHLLKLRVAMPELKTAVQAAIAQVPMIKPKSKTNLSLVTKHFRYVRLM